MFGSHPICVSCSHEGLIRMNPPTLIHWEISLENSDFHLWKSQGRCSRRDECPYAPVCHGRHCPVAPRSLTGIPVWPLQATWFVSCPRSQELPTFLIAETKEPILRALPEMLRPMGSIHLLSLDIILSPS